MISVTKLNGSKLIINADWIRTIEATPDTLITLMNGYKILVKESPEELQSLFLAYKKSNFNAHPPMSPLKAFEKELL